jgi:hypothetical protein
LYHFASINGKATNHLVQFIQSAQKTLDCAIYDLKDHDVVSALKSVANKVTLRIAYDDGKQKTVTGGPMVGSLLHSRNLIKAPI